jgi:hypothetical protein
MSTFTAVGMRFRGNHRFTPNDQITLEADNENPCDSNAVKVMVDGRHVAYASREDCPKLRQAIGRGQSTARLIEHFGQSATLTLVDSMS